MASYFRSAATKFVSLSKTITMKKLILIICFISAFYSCNSTRQTSISSEEIAISDQDTVRIANDELEYEIIIIEPGFNNWLVTTARPEGYYSQSFLESRNLLYVAEWNRRVINSTQYNPNLYEMQIDYQQGIDYGYEVNYKLYNYFIYFQRRYKQKLAGLIPRI
jgi:hypothetical protein